MITGAIAILIWLVCVAITIALFAFWIWMLVDCIKNPNIDSTARIVWVLVIVFLHALGAFIYLLAGRNKSST